MSDLTKRYAVSGAVISRGEYKDLQAMITRLQEQLEQHEEAARILWGFQQAYPTDIFPEIEDWKEVNHFMEQVGLNLSRISASNMRHVTKCITDALPDTQEEV